MKLKTLEWARGLRASLAAEIDAVLAAGLTDSLDTARVATLRQQLTQVDSLLAALQLVILDSGDDKLP